MQARGLRAAGVERAGVGGEVGCIGHEARVVLGAAAAAGVRVRAGALACVHDGGELLLAGVGHAPSLTAECRGE
jgi:hypothetical protein